MTQTLLLVDDEFDIVEPMRVILEDEYKVLIATSGEDALEILQQEPVDLIISDQRMPSMTGVEFLTRVKEKYPLVVRIIMTGYTDADAMIQAVNDGRVYRYIIKPWNVDEMRVVIRQALEHKDLMIKEGRLNTALKEAHRDLAKRTEELERAQQTIVQNEKLAAVGRFAAEMVHEMNNHLNIVLGLNSYLNMTLEEEVPELKDLEVQVKTLAEIAKDIRDFAKGAVSPLQPVVTDPIIVAEEVARACMHHPAFRNINLHLANENVTSWRINPKQLRHLLMNLLKNAAKASKSGDDIKIHVLAEGNELLFRIKDQGVGISESAQKKIFNAFYTTWENNGQGTGLGLSICNRIVKAHGGRITVESAVGEGSTFTVRIPRID